MYPSPIPQLLLPTEALVFFLLFSRFDTLARSVVSQVRGTSFSGGEGDMPLPAISFILFLFLSAWAVHRDQVHRTGALVHNRTVRSFADHIGILIT